MSFSLSPRIGSAFILGLLAVSFTVLGAGSARADDPPARVGRLGYMEGTVTFHNPTDTQWSYSALNYPVTAGLSFWTEPQSRAELQIGSSLLRLDSTTEIDVLRLDAAATQIQLEQGTISLRIVNMLPGRTVEIETPHGAVSLIQPGTYHIDAGDANTPTSVAALEGTARFIGPHSYLEVEAGEQATAIGDPANYTMNQAQTTPFDDWALQRDRRERESQTVKYVSPEMTGYQDLDDYGTWRPSPQYGEVWVPQSVPSGWAPYREGHWAWVAPWGWTWIDDAPWGFAPFHYGRWAQVDGSWAWVPGQPVERPVYSPALVAFAAGIAFGQAVGWLPLGPGEPYYPPYRTSPGYLRNVNTGAVPPSAMGNFGPRRQPPLAGFANHGAATFMSRAAFTSAQPVAHATLTPPAGALQAQAASTSLKALRPTPAAFAARPATAGTATPAGPTAASQAQERHEIEGATPKTLATTGKAEVQEHPGQAIPAHPEIVAHERVTVPGPSVAPAVVRAAPPLRQEQLVKSLTAPAQEGNAQKAAQQKQVAAQQAAERNQAAAAQAAREHAAAAPAFVKAEVPKPVQSAPLRPTPAGWNRPAPAAPKPEPKPEGKPDEKKPATP